MNDQSIPTINQTELIASLELPKLRQLAELYGKDIADISNFVAIGYDQRRMMTHALTNARHLAGLVETEIARRHQAEQERWVTKYMTHHDQIAESLTFLQDWVDAHGFLAPEEITEATAIEVDLLARRVKAVCDRAAAISNGHYPDPSL